jgi:hypothetical protein
MPGESRPRDPQEMGFLESVFSYIFGDGDPNLDLETKRLQLASNMIRANNGAVTAEQLAPFCDPDVTAGDETSFVNEVSMLCLFDDPRFDASCSLLPKLNALRLLRISFSR